MAFESGDVVADYEVLRSLGEGAVAEVYLVKHRVTGRLEAMKVLHRRGLADLRVDRFLREIRLQAGLSHPNIAAVRTALEVDGELLMIMEYVEGRSLRTIIEQNRPNATTALDYVLQALSALEYAHGHQITHRDVTPSNMLVSAGDKLKLTDFGLAKAMGHPSLTQTGTPLGSLYYMSPEHVRGVAAADHRSDIYSVGAVLYELVTGSPPFQGNNAFQVMRAQVEEQPRSPSEVVPGLLPGIEDVLLRALQKDPESRFASAGEMRQALAGFKQELKTGWTTAPVAGKVKPRPAAATRAKDLSQLFPTRLRLRMKQPHWWARSLGAAAAVLLLVAWVWTQPLAEDVPEASNGPVTVELADRGEPAAPPTIQTIDEDVSPAATTEDTTPVVPARTRQPVEPADTSTPRRAEVVESTTVTIARDSSPVSQPSIAVSGAGVPPIEERASQPAPQSVAESRDESPQPNGNGNRIGSDLARSVDKGPQPELLQTLRVPRLSALTVSRDGSLLAGVANENVVRVWNPKQPRSETHLEGHLAPVTALAFGPESRLLASGDRSGALKLWDLDSGREVAALTQKGAVQFVAFSRDGAWVATGSSDDSVVLWKRAGENGAPRWERAMKGHREPPLAVAFSPDGTQVVTSSDEQSVRVWPVLTEAKPQRIEVREGGARDLTFSQDGRWLAAASGKSLTIWDASHLEQARQVDIPDGRHVVAFTPSGLCLIASATLRTLRLWEATTGQELAVLDTDIRVEEMAMTPGGDRLIVADANGGLRVWQVPIPDASSLRAQSTLPAGFHEAVDPPSDAAAGSESEGNPLGIFRHVVDVFR